MTSLISGTVGILPPGALGVSFYYHLSQQHPEQVWFIERRGSKSSQSLRSEGHIRVTTPQGITTLTTEQVLKPNLLCCYQQGTLPEVILICPNPDQLLEVITTCVELLILIAEAGELSEEDAIPFPLLVFCANGIYFQRFRQIFIEKLEEGTLFGRLPDLWPLLMPRIVGRFLRGVTIQTGVREGADGATLYRPGPRGLTKVAGGDPLNRERACSVLTELGGWFEEQSNYSPTRLEFDKALTNLVCNLLGQLWAIDEHGQFRCLTVGEILIPAHEPEIRTLITHVLHIGQAVKAYPAGVTAQALYQDLLHLSRLHGTHIPSSLQWVSMGLRLGTLRPEVTPTEAWLVDPLIRYAKSAGLEDIAQYFVQLKAQLVEKLACAIHPQTILEQGAR